MLPEDRLDAILQRAETLQEKMNGELPPQEFVSLSKEYARLEPVVAAVTQYQKLVAEIDDLKSIIGGTDDEMKELAEAELPELEEILPEAQQELEIMLLPKDEADDMNVILEVRAGTGGDEAALFAGDLFRMYCRHAELNGYKVEILSTSNGDIGGYKEVVGHSGRLCFCPS